MRVRVVGCLLLVLMPLGANGYEPVTVVAHRVDGSELSGTIESWSVPGKLAIRPASADPVEVAAADLDSVEFRDAKLEAPDGTWVVRLNDGSTWFGEITGGDEQQLVLQHATVGPQTIPIDAVASVVRREDRTRRLPAASDEDVLLLANGDTVRGTMSGATQDGLALSVGAASRRFTWKDVRELSLAQTRPSRLEGISAIVFLNDGSRFRAISLNWRDGTFDLAPAGGKPLAVRPGLIAAIEIAGGRRTWLGDIKPARYQSTPFFSKTWPLRVDENVMGGPLTIGGRVYRHGLGLHAACTASWELGGKYQRFRALVGIDDSAGSAADADVLVSLDGRVVVEHRHLVTNAPTKSIDIDATGAKELVIEVGFGRGGHVQDRIDLVNAALIAK